VTRAGLVHVAVTLSACATLAGACGPRSNKPPVADDAPAAVAPSTGRTILNPPNRAGLQPVSVPDAAGMEPSVRDQLRARYSSLAAQIEHRPINDAALGTAYGGLGRLLMAASYFDAAEACYLNAQTLAPADRQWPYYLGHLYKAKGPVAKSVEAFETALQLRPTDVATLVWLGDAYLAQGRSDTAQPLFNQALTLEPNSAAAHFGAGRVALAKKDYPGAVTHLEKVLALDSQATATHYQLGMAYRGRGDLPRAEAHLAKKGTIEPRPNDPLMRALDELLDSAEAYNIRRGRELEAGNWSAAAEDFRKGLALKASDPSLRHRFGTALYQMGDVAGAVEQFQEVIRTSPEFAKAYFSLGVVMEAAGRHQEAIESFSNAVKHDAGYIQARLQLARVLARSGRPLKGLTEYQQVLEGDPAMKEAVFGYAMTLVRLRRYRQARDRLGSALKSYPADPMFSHALARLLAAAPDVEVRNGAQAKALVDELLKTERSIDVGATAAMALAELGEYEQAAAVQREVIATAEKAGLHDVVRYLADNLKLYERRLPCRTPFTDDELP
jgi:tetratricopeptide (TPR) repeat protein